MQQEGWEQVSEQKAAHTGHLRAPPGLAVARLGPLRSRARDTPVRGALSFSAAAPGGRPPGPASGSGAPHTRRAQRGTAGRALPRRRRAPVRAGLRTAAQPLRVPPRPLGSQPRSRGPPRPRRTQLGGTVAAAAAAAESLHICRAPRAARRRGQGGRGVGEATPCVPPLHPLSKSFLLLKSTAPLLRLLAISSYSSPTSSRAPALWFSPPSPSKGRLSRLPGHIATSSPPFLFFCSATAHSCKLRPLGQAVTACATVTFYSIHPRSLKPVQPWTLSLHSTCRNHLRGTGQGL